MDWLSEQLGSDYAILQIDQAPAHTSSAIRWSENIIPLLQPPHSPELNPVERLWQFLKKSLKNELFSSLQNLRERIQQLFDSSLHFSRLCLDLLIILFWKLFSMQLHIKLVLNN